MILTDANHGTLTINGMASGGGSITGSGLFNGGQCSGSTSQIQFQGTCSNNRMTLRYTFTGGQVGSMNLTACQ